MLHNPIIVDAANDPCAFLALFAYLLSPLFFFNTFVMKFCARHVSMPISWCGLDIAWPGHDGSGEKLNVEEFEFSAFNETVFRTVLDGPNSDRKFLESMTYINFLWSHNSTSPAVEPFVPLPPFLHVLTDHQSGIAFELEAADREYWRAHFLDINSLKFALNHWKNKFPKHQKGIGCWKCGKQAGVVLINLSDTERPSIKLFYSTSLLNKDKPDSPEHPSFFKYVGCDIYGKHLEEAFGLKPIVSIDKSSIQVDPSSPDVLVSAFASYVDMNLLIFGHNLASLKFLEGRFRESDKKKVLHHFCDRISFLLKAEIVRFTPMTSNWVASFNRYPSWFGPNENGKDRPVPEEEKEEPVIEAEDEDDNNRGKSVSDSLKESDVNHTRGGNGWLLRKNRREFFEEKSYEPDSADEEDEESLVLELSNPTPSKLSCIVPTTRNTHLRATVPEKCAANEDSENMFDVIKYVIREVNKVNESIAIHERIVTLDFDNFWKGGSGMQSVTKNFKVRYPTKAHL